MIMYSWLCSLENEHRNCSNLQSFLALKMAQQANIEAVLAENQRLRQSLVVMVTDRKKMASKLTGVQNLGLQLQKKEQQNKTLLEKIERLEGSLARAENRITQLNLQLPSGAQMGAVVTPGVSKKVLEALTRDNTKLKQALEHMTNKGPAGVDLAVVSAWKVGFSLCKSYRDILLTNFGTSEA